MPLGDRMGLLALARFGIEREPHHTLHVIAELGEGHPQTCLMDGIQAATGATFGKTLIEKTHWGKLAATFWYPGKTASATRSRRRCWTSSAASSSLPTGSGASSRRASRPSSPRR
jgi:formylmethanofuran dehydrogenase subunit E